MEAVRNNLASKRKKKKACIKDITTQNKFWFMDVRNCAPVAQTAPFWREYKVGTKNCIGSFYQPMSTAVNGA